MSNDQNYTRRAFLEKGKEIGAGAGLAALAGCLDGSSATENTTTTENYDSEETTYEDKQTETTTEQPEQEVSVYHPAGKIIDPANFGSDGYGLELATPSRLYESLSDDEKQLAKKDWQEGKFVTSFYFGVEPHQVETMGMETSTLIEYVETGTARQDMVSAAEENGFVNEGDIGNATLMIGEDIELKSLMYDQEITDTVALVIGDGEGLFIPASKVTQNGKSLEEAVQAVANAAGYNKGGGTVRETISDASPFPNALEDAGVAGEVTLFGTLSSSASENNERSATGRVFKKAKDSFEHDIGVKSFEMTESKDLSWDEDLRTLSNDAWDGDTEEDIWD